MKNKKILFLSILLMMTLLFIPNIVNAEEPINIGGANIILENIKLGGKGQKTTYAEGGEHFWSPTINITWYKSSNGIDFELMDDDSIFDYNTYYKAELDVTYDDLSKNVDPGYELGNVSIHIIDEINGKEETINQKSYSNSKENPKLEYVFEPFWKYDVDLYLENMEYIGPKQIVEGEEFVGQLVPKKNYRLPNEDEIKYMKFIDISVDFVNNHTGAFDKESGYIKLNSWFVTGDIYIKAIAVEKEKIEFKNNKYSYVKNNIKNELDFIVPFQEDIDTISIGEQVLNNSDYYYDKTNNCLGIYDDFLDKLEVGTYILRIENSNRYAETTLSVQELEVVEEITIDFRKISNVELLTEDQQSAFQFLGIDKGKLTVNMSLNALCDKNQKILLYVDEENNITLVENISNLDNIVYTLSEEDIETYKKEYAVFQVPKKIEIIFAEESYKVTFDANGGKFKDNDKIVIEDIINFDYTNFDIPTRENYKFIGFFTEKTGGKSFEEIMSSEEGINSDIIFYAQWEEITTGEEAEREEQEDNIHTGNTNTDNTNQDNTNTGGDNDAINDNNVDKGNNPQTSDNIMLYVAILSISVLGIIVAINVRRKKQNN